MQKSIEKILKKFQEFNKSENKCAIMLMRRIIKNKNLSLSLIAGKALATINT
jgi:hypothetical protein